jgi:ribonuclease D
VPPRWIDDDAAFLALIGEVAAADVYSLDTEFHRERTYFPQLALVQLAWDDQIALVDPLAVSMAPLAKVLEGPGLAVVHAASQDLEVLDLACGAVPSRLFDTQLAAGFLGHTLPALSSLVEREFGKRLPKGDRLTDWLRRPLRDEQKSYAASDVQYLVPLYETLTERLEARGRLSWVLEECELQRRRNRVARDPDEAWLRIKEARSLRPPAAGVAWALAAWRERRAAETDQPIRFVLPDLALVGIAQRAPTTIDELKRVRGVDDRHLRRSVGAQILDAVQKGREARAPRGRPDVTVELDRRLRPAISLVSAWVSQLTRECEIETSLVATRADIEALLADAPSARLRTGWRAELVGEPIRQLVAGEAALAFDGHGGLLLERRSQQPIG